MDFVDIYTFNHAVNGFKLYSKKVVKEWNSAGATGYAVPRGAAGSVASGVEKGGLHQPPSARDLNFFGTQEENKGGRRSHFKT
ncbi:MAG: hypothetical protein D9V47_05480 [Clostridia bacterium]|nr:MAG: hypothetical protein D9V47_05480 [Clostridia bacterium]